MKAKMKKLAETYRPFASENKTGDWVLVVESDGEWVAGRYATREEADAVRKAMVPGFVEDSIYTGWELLAPHKTVSEARQERFGGDVGSIEEDTVTVDLLEMHRVRESRAENRMFLWREGGKRKPGRILRMMENKRVWGFSFDA